MLYVIGEFSHDPDIPRHPSAGRSVSRPCGRGIVVACRWMEEKATEKELRSSRLEMKKLYT